SWTSSSATASTPGSASMDSISCTSPASRIDDAGAFTPAASDEIVPGIEPVGARLQPAEDPAGIVLVLPGRQLAQVHGAIFPDGRLVRAEQEHQLGAQAAHPVLFDDDAHLARVEFHERAGGEHAHGLDELLHQLALEGRTGHAVQLTDGVIGRLR